jgi:hypothetical protein
MPLSWNEIKDRALKFSHEWADDSSEDAEAKSFWDAFFTVFGVPRRPDCSAGLRGIAVSSAGWRRIESDY